VSFPERWWLVGIVWWVVSFLVGIVIAFYLGLFAGKQARYVGIALLRAHRWVRNDWLCLRCMGSHNVDGSMCLFCRRCNELSAQMHGYTREEYISHLGYVRWGYLMHNWDWNLWRERPMPRNDPMRVGR
jgi:hypothetical protein